MTYHEWGDEDFDWEGLGDAEIFIRDLSIRFARLSIGTKEKYGSIRYQRFLPIEKYFERERLRGEPRYVFLSRKLFWKFGNKIYNLYSFKLRMQVFYIIVYFACRKYPHIASEIVDDLLSGYDGKVPWYARRWVSENPWK